MKLRLEKFCGIVYLDVKNGVTIVSLRRSGIKRYFIDDMRELQVDETSRIKGDQDENE